MLVEDGTGTETQDAGGPDAEVEDITGDLVFKGGNTEYDASTPEGRAALQRDLDAQVRGLSTQGQEISFLKEQVADLKSQVTGGQRVREDMENKGATEDEIQSEIKARGFVTEEQAEKRAAEISTEMINAAKSADMLNDALDEFAGDKEGHPDFDDKAVMQRLKEMGLQYYQQLGTDKKTVKRRVQLAYDDLMKEAGERKPKQDDTARPRSRVYQERPGAGGTSRLKPPPAKRPGMDDDEQFGKYLAEQLPERD